jgi:hypothetical protein
MDLFQSVLDLERSAYQEGSADGVRDGVQQGTRDGLQMAMDKGTELGLEGSDRIWAWGRCCLLLIVI